MCTAVGYCLVSSDGCSGNSYVDTVLGCLVLGIGVCVTLFTERVIGFLRVQARPQWVKDLMGSDVYSLFMWLGGIGFIVAGAVMVFWGLTAT